MSLSEGVSSITSSEFTDRLRLIEEEWHQHTKLDWYLASICYHLHKLFFIMGGECKLQPEDFLLTFDAAKTKPNKELTLEEVEAGVAASKQKWFAFVGLGKDGKKDSEKVKNPKPVPRSVPPRDGRGGSR